jgi:hypothetical protein
MTFRLNLLQSTPAPPYWHLVDSALDRQFPQATYAGFIGKLETIRRFAARYRLAVSFDAVTFHEGKTYTQGTADGYAALFRVFLHWSAFEVLREISGLTRDHQTVNCLAMSVGSADTANTIYAVDGHAAYLNKVKEKLDDVGLRDRLGKFLRGEPRSVLAVPRAIRHIFAHGDLTPHAGGGPPEICSAICDSSSELVKRLMDEIVIARISDAGLLPV